MKRIAVAFLTLFLTAPLAESAQRDRPRIRVEKKKRMMHFERGGKVVRSFRIGLGGSPVGDKRVEGDLKTPEGRFYVAWKNPGSDYHRFFGLSYPMPRHARRALAEGRTDDQTLKKIERAARRKRKPPQFTGLGGLVGVHGGGAGADWTLGCIALSDEEVEWIYDRIRVGDEVVVLP